MLWAQSTTEDYIRAEGGVTCPPPPKKKESPTKPSAALERRCMPCGFCGTRGEPCGLSCGWRGVISIHGCRWHWFGLGGCANVVHHARAARAAKLITPSVWAVSFCGLWKFDNVLHLEPLALTFWAGMGGWVRGWGYDPALWQQLQ